MRHFPQHGALCSVHRPLLLTEPEPAAAGAGGGRREGGGGSQGGRKEVAINPRQTPGFGVRQAGAPAAGGRRRADGPPGQQKCEGAVSLDCGR